MSRILSAVDSQRTIAEQIITHQLLRTMTERPFLHFFRVSGFLLGIMLIFPFCRKEDNGIIPVSDLFKLNVASHLTVSEDAPMVSILLPDYFTGMFDANEVAPSKFELGRVIFYDRHLSEDGLVSCASCHRQENGFSDPRRYSQGIYGRLSTRNSMALGNTIWFGGAMGIDSIGGVRLPLFWDSRAHSVGEQARSAFLNEHEMGLSMVEVIERMGQQSYYTWLINRAWGDSLISEDRVFEALAHFMGSISSSNTEFDRALQSAGGFDFLGGSFPAFSEAENRGKTLYLEHCHSCHGSLYSPPFIFEANNGLENPYTDPGKGAISGLFYERGVFRVPGLRNISVSGPYMHDGRFETLLEVVEHYSSGVQSIFGLHGDLLTFNEVTQTYSPKHLQLTEADKLALVAFLQTLEDGSLLTDSLFSDPFRK